MSGFVFGLPQDGLSIGRGRTNTITIPDAGLSRHHCEITRSGDRFLLRDLGSKNGTSVNGLPAAERQLENGDQIGLSDSAFIFSTDARQDSVTFARGYREQDHAVTISGLGSGRTR